MYARLGSSAILLREQFLNVSLAPAGLNFLVLEDYGKNVRENLRYWREQMSAKKERETERGRDGEGDKEPDTEWVLGIWGWMTRINHKTYICKGQNTHTDTHGHTDTHTQVARYIAPGEMAHRRTTVHVSVAVCVWSQVAFSDWQCGHLLSRPYGQVRSINKQKQIAERRWKRELVNERKRHKMCNQHVLRMTSPLKRAHLAGGCITTLPWFRHCSNKSRRRTHTLNCAWLLELPMTV